VANIVLVSTPLRTVAVSLTNLDELGQGEPQELVIEKAALLERTLKRFRPSAFQSAERIASLVAARRSTSSS
jgi:hypothetical protein